MSQNDAKDIDIESTCGGNEQPNLQLQVNSQLQRNPLNWYDNNKLCISRLHYLLELFISK